jgi:hypothetical protein
MSSKGHFVFGIKTGGRAAELNDPFQSMGNKNQHVGGGGSHVTVFFFLGFYGGWHPQLGALPPSSDPVNESKQKYPNTHSFTPSFYSISYHITLFLSKSQTILLYNSSSLILKYFPK